MLRAVKGAIMHIKIIGKNIDLVQHQMCMSPFKLLSGAWSKTIEGMKKCLKIPNGQSEAVNRRKTDNTMVKRTKTLHRKLNIEHHELHWKLGVNLGAPEGKTVSALQVAPVVFL